MLNANDLPQMGKKSNTPPLDPSNYPARVVGIIDLGVQPQRPFREKEKPPVNEIMMTYELTSEFMKDDDGNDLEDKPRHKSETFPFYPLTADLAKSTKRYRALDPKGEHRGDFSKLGNIPCTLTIVINKDKNTGKIYENISAVTPPMKGFTVPELKNPLKIFDRNNPDMEVWEKFPNWLQDKIKKGLDFNSTKLATILGAPPKKEEEPSVTDHKGQEQDTPF